MAEQASAVDDAELAALKQVALAGALDGEATVSCSDLATRLGASDQTASRRLRALESSGHLERSMAGDGQRITITREGERVLEAEYEDYRRLFEGHRPITLHGWVTGGMGEGRHYISLPGYMEQFRERLGYEPFPGTLNVDLEEAAVREQSALDAVDAVPIDGWEDDQRTYGPAVCYPARLEADAGMYDRAHVIAPERTHHDEDHVEVITPEKLRDALGLEDDDHLAIHIEGN